MTQIYSNNAGSTLASSISAIAQSITVATNTGNNFPSPSGSDFFLLTLISYNANGMEDEWEIVKVTARSGDTLSVLRNYESSGAQAWNAGTKIEMRLTAGSMDRAEDAYNREGLAAAGATDNTLRWDGTEWTDSGILQVSATDVIVYGTLLSPGAGTSSFRAGPSAGSVSQGDYTVAVGRLAGSDTQGGSSVAVGSAAGNDNQGGSAVAIGSNAGRLTQQDRGVAVGYRAGYDTQGTRGVAVGNEAGETTQGDNAVAVGNGAGQGSATVGDFQGDNAVAVGRGAGASTQGSEAVAVGYNAGNGTQGVGAVAVGLNTGLTGQGIHSVGVGTEAGKTDQGSYAVAVGRDSGETNQGNYGVAMGYLAGNANQGANGIIINSSGSALDDNTAGHIHIASDDGSVDYTAASGWSMSAGLDVAGNIASNRHSIPGNSSVLGRMDYTGYTVGTTEYIGARVVGKTAQAWTASVGGTKLEFETTANGGLTRAVNMTLSGAGDLEVTGDVTADTFLGDGAVITGGTTGQVLQKTSATDYALEWADAYTYTLPFTDNSTNWDTAHGWGDHSSEGYATQTYVNTQVSNLVDSSPGTLDTLNELANALGDDPNFATTVTNSIGTKLDSSAVSTYGLSLIDDANAAAARATLGLGTAATTASSAYATTGQVLTNVPSGALFTDTVYGHPSYASTDINTSGAEIVDIIATNGQGHVTDLGTRTLTLANLGYTGATDANNYDHPDYATTNINTSGATIVDVISTNAQGHVTSLGSRTLTGSDLGINKAYIDALNVDADTLDGVTSANFLRSNANDTMVGNLTMDGDVTVKDNKSLYIGTDNDHSMFFDGTHLYLDVGKTVGSANSNFYIRDGSDSNLRFIFHDSGNFEASGNITAYSDARIKSDIEVIPNAVDKVQQLRGVTYVRTDKKEEEADVRHTGVVAQEVLEVLPEAVHKNENGMYSVAYGNMVGLLIEAIKEQQIQIDELKESR